MTRYADKEGSYKGDGWLKGSLASTGRHMFINDISSGSRTVENLRLVCGESPASTWPFELGYSGKIGDPIEKPDFWHDIKLDPAAAVLRQLIVPTKYLRL